MIFLLFFLLPICSLVLCDTEWWKEFLYHNVPLKNKPHQSTEFLRAVFSCDVPAAFRRAMAAVGPRDKTQQTFTNKPPAVTTCYGNYYFIFVCHSLNIIPRGGIFQPEDKVSIQCLRNQFKSLFCFLTPPAQLSQGFLCLMAFWYIEIYSVTMRLSLTHGALKFLRTHHPPCVRHSTVDS